jgi:hypothetical protein
VTAETGAEGTVPTAPTGTQAPSTGETGSQAPTQNDRGYPADTPVTQMTAEQQAAYWKRYARTHESAVKAFKGMTPEQVSEMQSRLEAMEAEKLTADEKALKQARKEAADQAAAAAKAELTPQLQALKVESIAGRILQDEAKLQAFMEVVDPAKFVDAATGDIDKERVTTTLTAMFGQQQQRQVYGPRWQNAGQGVAPAPQTKPGEAGRAEAQKRAAARKTNTT